MHFFHWILAGAALLAATLTAGHALFNKRDPRAAWGWIAVTLVFPLAGPAIYVLFGVNRVRTKGSQLLQRSPFTLGGWPAPDALLADAPEPYRLLARTSFAITGRPLLGGNDVIPLFNGEQAFPAMLQAIENAKEKIWLSTYIFENNATGRHFVEALEGAMHRGVDVRVLVDGVGELTGLPTIGALLRRRKIPFARFLPPRLVPPSLSVNLRLHHKILVVDGSLGFTGGMNIGDRYLAGNIKNPKRVLDLHFSVRGPIVAQMEEVFLWAWGFATGQETTKPSGHPAPAGGMICRTVADGPDEDLDKLPAILQAACASAQERLCIMTPYFLPPRELIGALQTAALRGVRVEVLLPEHSDLWFMDRAARNMLWEVLQHGVRVFYQPSPFAHSKLFMVDDHYALVGSTNMDPRSLRLNFEFTVEVYDQGFVRKLQEHFDTVRSRSRETSLEEVDNRPFGMRLLDSLCWLFSPYL